jgi:hypothetical protein
MSDSNRVGLAFIVETTYGVFPTGNPTLQDLRFTSESFTSDTSSTISQEVREDRQIPDVVRTGLSASGDLAFEFSVDSYDVFIQAAMQSFAADVGTWGTAEVIAAADVAVTGTDTNTLTHASGWDHTPTIGEWIEVRGFSGAGVTANAGFFKVETASATVITVEGAPLLADASGEAIDINQWPTLENGTTFKSYAVEKDFDDDAGSNFAFTNLSGLAVDQWAFSIASDQLNTGSFSFIGKSEDQVAVTSGDGSNTAATTTPITNGIDNVKQVKLGATDIGVIAFTMQLQNNLRARLQVGTLGAVSVGSGVASFSGTLQAYFATGNKAELDKYHDFTLTDLSFVVEDSNGDGYVFDFPAVKLTAGTVVSGGQNQDTILDFQWQAVRSAVEGNTLRIAKFT